MNSADVMLDAVLQPENIDRAWRRVRNDKAPWVPRVDFWDWKKEPLPHILRLLDAVRDTSYQPLPLREFAIDKADGRKRIIASQFMRDKFAQRLVHQVLEPVIDPVFHPDSYGYRRGKNIEQACRRARHYLEIGLSWVIDLDIKRFFDSVDQTLLLEQVKAMVPSPVLNHYIGLWLNQSCDRFVPLRPRRGVAQGTVLAPILCNLYLNHLDSFFSQQGIAFVRFADNILLFCQTRDDVAPVTQCFISQLQGLKLAVNMKKSRVWQGSTGIEYLGYRVRPGKKIKPLAKE